MEREWNFSNVVAAVAWEERWRYKHRKSDDPVKPRQIVVDYMLSPHITPFDFLSQDDAVVTLDPSLPSGRHFRTLEHIADFVELPTQELLQDYRVCVFQARGSMMRSFMLQKRAVCCSQHDAFAECARILVRHI